MNQIDKHSLYIYIETIGTLFISCFLGTIKYIQTSFTAFVSNLLRYMYEKPPPLILEKG